MNNNKLKVAIPFMLAIAVIVGVYLGKAIVTHSLTPSERPTINIPLGMRNSKMDYVMELIGRNYAEEVNTDSITEKVLPQILAQLDPHSVYISSTDVQKVNEDLDGSFVGIGVQFNIQKDTTMIVAVINGGPSERVGILPGDRIVEVNDSSFVGEKITNDYVMKTLRGKLGTSVKVGIKRNGVPEILHFNINRQEIPVNSVDVYYAITPEIGYIKVSKFGATTYSEFLTALTSLKQSGCRKFIVDLRGNPGGYMDAACAMVNEFLSRGQLIVYLEGRAYKRENTVADGHGVCQQAPVVVLLDEWSASASEIFAGAIQDNDRGTIIGRRSFGKGLVQNQFYLPDSSAVRLTIARYFTPSGRCIQKPFKMGETEEYENDIMNRYLHGEMDEQDSIQQTDSLRYFTSGGRVVYGGGGIMPDIFVARDTSLYSSYYNKLVYTGVIYQFAFQYADKNRAELSSFKTWKSLTEHLRQKDLIKALVAFAEKEKNINPVTSDIRKSQPLIQNLLEAYICRDMLGENGFFPIFNQTDNTVAKAVEHLTNN